MRFKVMSSNPLGATGSRGWMSAEEALELIRNGSGPAHAQGEDGNLYSDEDLEALIADEEE